MSALRVEAVIFDLDGVLVDTEPITFRVLRELLAPQTIGEQEYAALVGLSGDHTVRWLRERYSRSETHEELRRLTSDAIHRALVASTLEPLDGAPELVEAIAGGGRALAVASQSSPRWVELSLRAIGLAGRFPVVVTASEVAQGKPAPDVYLRAAERLGVVAARCLVLEDSVPGVQAARAAGMTVVQLRQASHAADPQPGTLAVIDSLRAFDLRWLEGARAG